jgi:hypothetical protein
MHPNFGTPVHTLKSVNPSYLTASGGIFICASFIPHIFQKFAKLQPSDFSPKVTVNQSPYCFKIMSFERLKKKTYPEAGKTKHDNSLSFFLASSTASKEE